MTTPTSPIETLDFQRSAVPADPPAEPAGRATSARGATSFDLAVAYSPGVCNIGPEEIARRRRAGHVGAALSVATLGGLAAIRAPRAARLIVALPAALAASGYIQAQLHFCAGFGSRGVFNFGELGGTTEVLDPEARAIDRARSMQIGLASAAIGVAAGVCAVLLPVSRSWRRAG